MLCNPMDFLSIENICTFTVIVVLVLLTRWYTKIPSDLPPGPIGLPFVGYLPFIGKPIHLAFARLAEKYGPMYHLRLGNRLVIVLNDYLTIKEAFVKQAQVFAGRPHDANFFKRDQDRIGLIHVDGEPWRQHRRFVMSNLKDGGVGKLEPLLLNEIHCLMDELRKTCGQPTAMKQILCRSILNNIFLLVTGNRYDYDDPTLCKSNHIIHSISQAGQLIALRTFLPWISTLPIVNRHTKHQTRWRHIKDLLEIIKGIIETNREESLADVYMAQIENKTLQNKQSSFSVDGLLHICRDLLFAGTETTAKTLLWGMIYLTNNPHVQSKVQDEIDRVIGRERDPSFNDRSNTPYTLATINEIHRMASLVPLALPHRVTRDTDLLGYHIPKNTMIFPNLYSVHYDRKLWGDPDTFRPERFLSPDGQLNTPEYLIPFSTGKRQCAGEPLAKMEIYLYLTTILQNFDLVSRDRRQLPVDIVETLARSPLYDVICVEQRQKTSE